MNPSGELVQAKITLLAPLPAGSSNLGQLTRDERRAEPLFWQQHQLLLFMESLFQTAWENQTRENAILLTALKVGRQTSVSCYTATKCHYGLWWEKMFILSFPKEGEAYGETPQLQNPESAPEKSTKPPTAPTAITCTCSLCLQGRNPVTWAVRKNSVLTIWHSHRYASETVSQFRHYKLYSLNEILIATSEPDAGLVYLDKQWCHKYKYTDQRIWNQWESRMKTIMTFIFGA